MKKRILSVIMVLMMVMTFIPTTAFAAENYAPPLKISAEYADGKVIVTVKADPYSGCKGAQVDFSFPSDKLSATKEDVVCSGVLAEATKSVKSAGDGKVSTAWAGSSARQSDAEETIMTVTFSVIEGQTGECSFSIVNYSFTDGINGETQALPAGSTGTATVNIAAAPATYTVKVNGGTGVSRKTDPANGNSQQTVNQNTAIVPVVFEAGADYYFPEGYGVNSGKFGIEVKRNSPSKITVSGIPTRDVEIGLPAAAMKHENPNIPSVTPVHCTAAGNDGKITGVDATMEYKKGVSGDTWLIVGNNTELTGLAPDKYYVRYKATPTQKASAAAEVEINAYDPTVEKFTVTYKANGGTGADHSVQVDKGSNHVILGADACHFTAPQGERFVYWSTRADNGQGSEHYPAGYEYWNLRSNLTFYAVWETTTRTVQFDANGGTGTMQTVNVNLNDSYTLPDCTFTAPEGKEFDCWKPNVGQDTYKPNDTYPITGNVTFVAQWKDKQGGGEQQGFTLIFQPGEGSGRDHVVNGIGAKYNLPNPGDIEITPPAGKPIFDGWKAEDGTVYPAGKDVPVTADATYVAQWRADGPQGDTVLVTFKSGDGKGDDFEKREPTGESYRLPPKPESFEAPAGMVFAGWKIEDPQGNLNEKLYKAGHKFDLTEDVTFVAQWKTRPYYGDDTTTPDADPMVNPGTGAAPVGAPIAVVIAVAVAGAAYFVTTKKR